MNAHRDTRPKQSWSRVQIKSKAQLWQEMNMQNAHKQ